MKPENNKPFKEQFFSLLKRGQAPFIACLLVVFFISSPIVSLFTSVTIVDEEYPISFYSNQLNDDLRQTSNSYINLSKESILISSFGLTEESTLAELEKKREMGVIIQALYDARQFPKAPQVSEKIEWIPRRPNGLMHRKITLIDDRITLLGSTNLTKLSLKGHDNFIVALLSPTFGNYIKEISLDPLKEIPYQETIQSTHFQFWPMPSSGNLALSELIRSIDEATSSIDIALFTFTHRKIGAALIHAKQRGVDVRLFTDRKNTKGSNREIVRLLKRNAIPVYINQHRGLLHHKMALIDTNILFFGSANWTRSAFEKNSDYLVKLSPINGEYAEKMELLFQKLSTTSKLLP